MFQSSPGTLAGCDARQRDDGAYYRTFQSSPGTLAGCDDLPGRIARLRHHVSILTRHAGRVRLVPHTPYAPSNKFQSSPGTLAGCDQSTVSG